MKAPTGAGRTLLVVVATMTTLTGLSISSGSSLGLTGGTLQVFTLPGPRPTPPGAPPAMPRECGELTYAQVIVGTEGDDAIRAADGGALIFGLGGNDTIQGGDGKDCLVGDDGDDSMAGGNGKDVLLGGEGNDSLYGDAEGDVLEGGNGKDLLSGGAGVDACSSTDEDVYVDCEAPPQDGSSIAEPAPSDAPSATPADGSGPSLTPDPHATPSPTPDPGESQPLAPDPSAVPSSEPTLPTPAPTPEPTPAPTPEPTPAPTPDPTPDPSPDPTPSPTQAPPTVDFSISISGLTASFTNRAKAVDAWGWDFGDGASSATRNPDHTYATEGTYTVTLHVVGRDGSSASKSVNVTVSP